jgi:multisubunit Na+/H+ antiporter MnhF subunit
VLLLFFSWSFLLLKARICDEAGALTSVVPIRRSAAEAAASFCIRSYSYLPSLSWILSLSTNACTVRHIIQDPLVAISSIRLSVCLSVCLFVCLSGLIWSVCLILLYAFINFLSLQHTSFTFISTFIQFYFDKINA